MADKSGRVSVDEKEKLGKSVKSQHRYGTVGDASTQASIPELFIKHKVQKDETLPGIALKYGRTVSLPRKFSTLTSWLFASRRRKRTTSVL